MRALIHTLFIATVLPFSLRAGTLDDAPFTIVVPNDDWVLHDSARMKETHVIAVVANRKANMFSLIAKEAAQGKTLDGFYASTTLPLGPEAKMIAERTTTFLGYKAKQVEIEHPKAAHSADGSRSVPSYCIKTIFMIDGTAWSISCTGPIDQREACKRILDAYLHR